MTDDERANQAAEHLTKIIEHCGRLAAIARGESGSEAAAESASAELELWAAMVPAIRVAELPD